MHRPLPLGERLVASGHIDYIQLRAALAYQRQWGCRIGKALVELDMVSERALTAELARAHDVPLVSLRGFHVSPEVLRLLPGSLARKRRVFPLAEEKPALYYAAEQPQDLTIQDEVRFVFGGPVRPCLAADTEIEEAIALHYPETPRPDGARARARNGLLT